MTGTIGQLRPAFAALAVAASLANTAAARRIDQSEDAVAFQINPAHDGSVVFAAGFQPPLQKLWTVNLKSPARYPLIAGGTVYTVSHGNTVRASDVLTGKKLWQKVIPGGDNYGAYDSGSLFYYSDDGAMSALVAATGKQKWSFPAGAGSYSSAPIAVNGNLYIGGGALSAFNETTGALLWSRDDNATEGVPAYGDDGLYVGGPCQYYKFGTDGTQLWHDDNGCVGGGGISPVYFHNSVYLVDWAAGNFVLKSKNGELAGSFPGAIPPTFFSAEKNRTYELAFANAKLYCLDRKTGNVKWSFDGGYQTTPPIAINAQAVLGTSSGALYLLDGAKGKTLWSDNLGASITSMNAGDGVLAVASGTNLTVYAPQ
jgi:outer membrane protein assembly factor BamB